MTSSLPDGWYILTTTSGCEYLMVIKDRRMYYEDGRVWLENLIDYDEIVSIRPAKEQS